MCRHVARALARRSNRSLTFASLALLPVIALLVSSGEARAATKNKTSVETSASVSLGRELFLHRWTPGDSHSRDGDGLGPMFNERSCVACHSQGGIGGAGLEKHNVEVISISKSAVQQRQSNPAAVHPGLALNSSVVLHRSSLADGYDIWRSVRLGESRDSRTQTQILQRQCLPTSTPIPTLRKFDSQTPVEEVFASLQVNQSCDIRTTAVSEVNPPSLFGMGLIDALPNRAFEIAVRRSGERFAQTQGRIARLPDGRIGRFGWKASKATLAEFTSQACAVELGLEVPTHPQVNDPRNMNAVAKGLDLNKYDCDSLTAFVHHLPRPEQQTIQQMDRAQREGQRLFANIGCADCHQPNMGKIVGIYSDLLLHNMSAIGSAGGYGTTIRKLESKSDKLAKRGRRPAIEVAEAEWRTPPLWGCADSAPYWHDGRAPTLQVAIALHGGQARASAQKFKELSTEAQGNLLAFLQTMHAPITAERAPPEEVEPTDDQIASVE